MDMSALTVRERTSCRCCRAMSGIPICGSLTTHSTSNAPRCCAEHCPIRAQCLTAALEREEPWGVWGGEIVERGCVVAQKRPRGRPRKDAIAA